jgi:hypothetical protein
MTESRETAQPPVTAQEFEARLASLSLTGGGTGLPRKPRDRHIVLRAVAQALGEARGFTESAMSLSESAVNLALGDWLDGAGTWLLVDHVTLRRELVDHGYLRRDTAGSRYDLCVDGRSQVAFDPDVSAVDGAEVVRVARERATERAAAHRAKREPVP